MATECDQRPRKYEVCVRIERAVLSGAQELEAATGTRVLAQDACCQVIPVIEGEDVPCAQPQPAAGGERGRGIKGCPPPVAHVPQTPALTRGCPA